MDKCILILFLLILTVDGVDVVRNSKRKWFSGEIVHCQSNAHMCGSSGGVVQPNFIRDVNLLFTMKQASEFKQRIALTYHILPTCQSYEEAER